MEKTMVVNQKEYKIVRLLVMEKADIRILRVEVRMSGKTSVKMHMCLNRSITNPASIICSGIRSLRSKMITDACVKQEFVYRK